MNAKFLLCFIALILSFNLASEQVPLKKNILIIHSYHSDFTWTASIHKGILSTLSDSPYDLGIFTEYMDSKRYPLNQIEIPLFNLLNQKYSLNPPDVIIVSDNNALEFIVSHQDELFRNIPLVFTGINFFTDEELKDRSKYTGVLEEYDLAGTIRLALHLHPDTKNIAIIADHTRTGYEHLLTFRRNINQYLQQYQYHEFIGTPPYELVKSINDIDQPTIIFVVSYYLDKKGNVVSEKDLQFVAENIGYPIYTAWDNLLQYGATGGYIVNSNAQGSVAAKMAMDILEGKKPESIPIDSKSTIFPMFNYEQLQRFGIDLKQLPGNSIIIGEPEPIVKDYRKLKKWFSIMGVIFGFCVVFGVIIIFIKKHAKNIIREQRERCDLAIHGISLGLWDFYPLSQEVSLNDEWYNMLGYSGDEGIDPYDLIFKVEHPDDLDRVVREMEALNESGNEVLNIEHRMLKKNGSILWIRSQGKVVDRDKEGHAIRIIGINQNITDEKVAYEHRDRLLKAIEQVSESIFITDTDGKIIYVNKAFEKLNGYAFDEVYGSSYDAVIEKKSLLKIEDMVIRELNSGQSWSGTLLNQTREGDTYDADTTISPLKDINGRIFNYVFVVKDITERRRLEKQLAQSQKIDAVGTLAGGIAHDFNNILSAIMGFTELSLQELPPDSSVHEYNEEIMAAAERARKLVTHILTFSKHSQPDRKPIRMKSVISSTVDLLRSTLPITINIKVDYKTDNDTIMADPMQMNQVLMNLCTNASQALFGTSGAIRISVYDEVIDERHSLRHSLNEGNYLLLEIVDNGCGISAENLPKIFDPFYTTKRDHGNSGLGLSIVYGIIHEHFGEITVESQLGLGTKIEIYLPLIEPTDTLSEEETHVIPRGTEQILFVDDEVMIGEVVKVSLEKLGYRVEVHSSSVKALESFKDHPQRYDILITDLTMPELHGDKLAAEFHRIEPSLPIVLCTGYNQTDNLDNLQHVSSIIHKPFMLPDIARLIRKLLDKDIS